jgi:hypothetical protein
MSIETIEQVAEEIAHEETGYRDIVATLGIIGIIIKMIQDAIANKQAGVNDENIAKCIQNPTLRGARSAVRAGCECDDAQCYLSRRERRRYARRMLRKARKEETSRVVNCVQEAREAP